MDISRLSLNQITCDHNSLEELVIGCKEHAIGWIAPWRHKIQETGVQRSAQLIREAELRVSSLCRGGMFPADSKSEREARIDDNRRAIDEAAELGTDCLVLVCCPSPNRDIEAARVMVEEGIERLIPYAEQAGVKLGIEPLHPTFAADRSVIVSLGQANDIVERISSPQVGVVIDVYHVWWDPEVYKEIERATGTILGFHVNDWCTGGGDPFSSRGMMGDGVIEISRMQKAVEAAGYHGPIEVEIINDQISTKPYFETLPLTKSRFLEHV
jgi:sugar phosphate isomerase/epimerase